MERIYPIVASEPENESISLKTRIKEIFSHNLREILNSNGLLQRERLQLIPKFNIYELCGDWRVISSVPGLKDQKAFNSQMNFEKTEDGFLKLHYVFNDERRNGDVKQYIIQYSNLDTINDNKWKARNLTWYLSSLNIIYFNREDELIILASNDKKYFWILSKSRSVSDEQVTRLYQWLDGKGFDLTFARSPI